MWQRENPRRKRQRSMKHRHEWGTDTWDRGFEFSWRSECRLISAPLVCDQFGGVWVASRKAKQYNEAGKCSLKGETRAGETDGPFKTEAHWTDGRLAAALRFDVQLSHNEFSSHPPVSPIESFIPLFLSSTFTFHSHSYIFCFPNLTYYPLPALPFSVRYYSRLSAPSRSRRFFAKWGSMTSPGIPARGCITGCPHVQRETPRDTQLWLSVHTCSVTHPTVALCPHVQRETPRDTQLWLSVHTCSVKHPTVAVCSHTLVFLGHVRPQPIPSQFVPTDHPV